MTETPGSPAPRRRRSARREQGPPVPESPTDTPAGPTSGAADDRNGRLRKRPRRRPAASPMPVGEPPEPSAHPAGGRDRRVDHTERALRGLVTTRGTQVSWSAALRARDVAAPTAADLAEAAAEVVIVRRNYTPQEPLKNTRADPPQRSRKRP